MEYSVELDKKSTASEIQFDIKGNKEYGLDKTIINSLRRTLLSTIPTVAFRTEVKNSDLIIKKNDSSLHNEFISDRIGLIPLYINPQDYQKQYLFHLHVKNNPSEPITTITTNDFEIYPLKKEIDPTLIESINFSDYNKEKKLSQKQKDEIFKPFKYNGKNNYCLITELKTTNSSTFQEIELFGVPSVSYGYENAKWQAVSRSSYSFKRDPELFEKIFNQKVEINEIPKSKRAKYKKELFIAESERYFHRDENLEPYWYTFNIDSVHYLKSKDLFILSNQIIIEQLEKIHEEFPKTVSEEKTFIDLQETNKEGIYNVIFQGFDDTIGSIIQSHISNKMINDKSILSICGYKRTHPLEDTIIFKISLNRSNKIFQLNKPQQLVSIIEIFTQACSELIQIYSLIKSVSEKKL
jgi:DNA-directed RNA polymerase alpha subunit